MIPLFPGVFRTNSNSEDSQWWEIYSVVIALDKGKADGLGGLVECAVSFAACIDLL